LPINNEYLVSNIKKNVEKTGFFKKEYGKTDDIEDARRIR